MAKREKPVKPVSKFVGLVRLADKLGTKKVTNLRSKTEEGTITLKIDGAVCLTVDELRNQAAAVGGKLSVKAEGGFGEAEGSGGMSLDGRGAAVMVVGMCLGLKEVMKADEETDTDLEEVKEQTATA